MSIKNLDPASLANYDVDCLLHIFTRLPLSDALHLGLTCRRLFSLFEEARRTTRALALTSFDHIVVPKTIFTRNISPEAVDEEEFSASQLISFSLPKHIEGSSYGQIPLAITQKFVNTFVNIRFLEVASCFKPKDFCQLLSQLTGGTPTALPLLTTLKLCPDFIDSIKEVTPDYFWHPLATLEHPALRHLTLVMLDKLLKGSNKQNNQLYNIPQLPILCQLTTFNFFHDGEELSVFNQLFRLLTLPSNTHLTPGIGARFGLRLFKYRWEIKEIDIEPKLLAYFTYLNVQLGWNVGFNVNTTPYTTAMASLYRALPAMRHLQKIELTIGENCEQTTDYPDFLTALSSLEHLRELSIDCIETYKYGKGIRAWPPSSLPVLPSVRVFSLEHSTPNHTDVVEQFQLVHCFPGLQTLKCHFEQDVCYYCGYPSSTKSIRLSLFQACGKLLTRGLLKLPETVTKRELSFKFTHRYHYKSLESLLDARSLDSG